jgi:phage gp16-like protein
MSKIEKLIARLKTIPRDLTWDELVKVLAHYGYHEQKTGKTGGSRRKFINDQESVISMHKPHPSNIVKQYAIRQVIDHLNIM